MNPCGRVAFLPGFQEEMGGRRGRR
jgi:hypothetical protein